MSISSNDLLEFIENFEERFSSELDIEASFKRQIASIKRMLSEDNQRDVGPKTMVPLLGAFKKSWELNKNFERPAFKQAWADGIYQLLKQLNDLDLQTFIGIDQHNSDLVEDIKASRIAYRNSEGIRKTNAHLKDTLAKTHSTIEFTEQRKPVDKPSQTPAANAVERKKVVNVNISSGAKITSLLHHPSPHDKKAFLQSHVDAFNAFHKEIPEKDVWPYNIYFSTIKAHQSTYQHTNDPENLLFQSTKAIILLYANLVRLNQDKTSSAEKDAMEDKIKIFLENQLGVALTPTSTLQAIGKGVSVVPIKAVGLEIKFEDNCPFNEAEQKRLEKEVKKSIQPQEKRVGFALSPELSPKEPLEIKPTIIDLVIKDQPRVIRNLRSIIDELREQKNTSNKQFDALPKPHTIKNSFDLLKVFDAIFKFLPRSSKIDADHYDREQMSKINPVSQRNLHHLFMNTLIELGIDKDNPQRKALSEGKKTWSSFYEEYALTLATIDPQIVPNSKKMNAQERNQEKINDFIRAFNKKQSEKNMVIVGTQPGLEFATKMRELLTHPDGNPQDLVAKELTEIIHFYAKLAELYDEAHVAHDGNQLQLKHKKDPDLVNVLKAEIANQEKTMAALKPQVDFVKRFLKDFGINLPSYQPKHMRDEGDKLIKDMEFPSSIIPAQRLTIKSELIKRIGNPHSPSPEETKFAAWPKH